MGIRTCDAPGLENVQKSSVSEQTQQLAGESGRESCSEKWIQLLGAAAPSCSPECGFSGTLRR